MALTVRNSAFFFNILNSEILLEPDANFVWDQFVKKGIDFKAMKGDTVFLNRYPYFGDGGATLAARTISETATIGTADPVNQDVNQVQVDLKELAGPYNSVAAHVAPLGVTEKVALQAQQEIINGGDPANFFNSIGGRSLKRDHDFVHDRILESFFDQTTNERNPGGVADGATTASSQINADDLRAIKENLMTRNIPRWEDGLYYAVVSPRMERHLREDTDFQEGVRFGAPERLFRGEIGIWEGFRFFVSTNLPTQTINSLTAHMGYFFGPDAVGYGEGLLPLQVRRNKNDDYERFIYLIWLVYRGYALLDERFIEEARTFAA